MENLVYKVAKERVMSEIREHAKNYGAHLRSGENLSMPEGAIYTNVDVSVGFYEDMLIIVRDDGTT